MKVTTIYDQGDATIVEDQVIFSLPFVGVADGVSGLYLPDRGPRLFDGLSGGQMVVDALHSVAQRSYAKQSLEQIVIWANERVRRAQHSAGVPLDRSDLLAGASFALAKIGDEEIEIIQAGDCFALWRMYGGEYQMTSNQVFLHDMETRGIIARLMQKHAGDKQKVWEEFGTTLSRMRRERVNKKVSKSYGLLNGQHTLKDCWQVFTLSRKDVARVMLFTDGLIYYPESGDGALAWKVLELYQKGGLENILLQTRMQEDLQEGEIHIRHSEATAVAVEFDN